MLLLPSLDNRDFDQLVAEGQGQIAGLAPGWTDRNYSDPGVTVLELFAWLAETVLYRLDRTTDEMQRAFLRMVGVEPRPPLVAETVLLLSLGAGGAAAALPAGLQVTGPAAASPFQTTSPITVTPAALEAVLAGLDGAATPVATGPGGFAPFGAAPAAGAALYLGFDQPLGAEGVVVSLHAWTLTPAADRQVAEQLRQEAEDWRRAHGPHCIVPDWRLYPGVTTVWEYLAAGDRWLALSGVEDQTRALTLSGFVRFAAPPATGADAHTAGGPVAGLYVVRCRLTMAAPDCGPPLALVGVNAVPAHNAADAPPGEALGSSAGQAGESYPLALTPVVAGSCRLEARLGPAYAGTWDTAETWDLVGPHQRVCLMDPVEGLVATGDGARGRVFPAGAQITAAYRQGGGAAGNLAAGVLTAWLDNAHNQALVPAWTATAASLVLAQPVAAFGGADAEDIPSARARALALLAAPDKAVTLADFQRLALATPGVPVARAYALAEHHPDFPCFDAAGSVTVTVIPSCTGPTPTPSAGLLAAVAAHLEPRRMVTTEVHVAAPDYVRISVAATLVPAAGSSVATLAAAAQATLDRYLHPLTGGTDGTGWPAGRTVFSAEVLALLAEIPGVAGVTGLTLQADQDPPTIANVTVCPTQFVASGTHDFTGTGAAIPSISAGSPPHDCCR